MMTVEIQKPFLLFVADIVDCLLEVGPWRGKLLDRWKIYMPAAFDHIWDNPSYNWMYQDEPEAKLGARRIFQPRGELLGGSSAINGMCFVRGHALDFERWAEEGQLAGPGETCFPISSVWKAGKEERANIEAGPGR